MSLEEFIDAIKEMYDIKNTVKLKNRNIILPTYDVLKFTIEAITELYENDDKVKELVTNGDIVGLETYIAVQLTRYGDLRWITEYFNRDRLDAIQIAFREMYNYHQSVTFEEHLACEKLKINTYYEDQTQQNHINLYVQESMLLKNFYSSVMNDDFNELRQLSTRMTKLWFVKDMLDIYKQFSIPSYCKRKK